MVHRPSLGATGGQLSGLGRREVALERLAAREGFDLLVVGGGITGAGIALDAASRGLKVALVERFDFASGTSSKSSKLVHGGLRYLEHADFGLVREASVERAVLGKLAPHLVKPVPFVIPVSSRRRRAMFGVGLWAYDALASFRNASMHKHLDRAETEELVPSLPRGKVKGGYLFYDSKTDDVRLVMEVLVQARRRGAVVANHAAVRDIAASVNGCTTTVEDVVTGDVFEVASKRVIVAAGVWTDQLESMARHGARSRLRPSKGIHLVFSRERLPISDAGAFIPDAERRRMLFVIPWHEAVLVGTTDTTYEGELDHPAVDQADRTYCLESLNAVFHLGLTENDIVGAYAGLRPLIAGKSGETADLSRRHAVYDIAPGVVGITGGKLTTYRRMAKDAVDCVADALGAPKGSTTHRIRLGSSDVDALTVAVERRARWMGISGPAAERLVFVYGDRALEVLDVAANEGLADALVVGHEPIAAEAVYAARHEMAVDLIDLLSRRTRFTLLDREAGLGSGSHAAELLGAEYRWGPHELSRQIAACRYDVQLERGLPLGPPEAVPEPAGVGSA